MSGQKSAVLVVSVLLSSCVGGTVAEVKSESPQVMNTVVAGMLRSLPGSVRRVCVLKANLSPDQSSIEAPIDLRNLDPRIVLDPSLCSERGPMSSMADAQIVYAGAINELLKRRGTPLDARYAGNFKRSIGYIDRGDLLAGAVVSGCNSEFRAFVFDLTKQEPSLVEVVPLSVTECKTQPKTMPSR